MQKAFLRARVWLVLSRLVGYFLAFFWLFFQLFERIGHTALSLVGHFQIQHFLYTYTILFQCLLTNCLAFPLSSLSTPLTSSFFFTCTPAGFPAFCQQCHTFPFSHQQLSSVRRRLFVNDASYANDLNRCGTEPAALTTF